jgi:hypothetical protein
MVALIISATPLALLAANPHWQKPGQPTCSPATSAATGTSYGPGNCTSGVVAGLGNGDIKIVVTITASGDQFCVNGGGNEAPAHNPATAASTTPVNVPNLKDKNGSVAIPAIGPFSLTVTAQSPQAAGCPEGYKNGYVRLANVTFDGHYSFQQPADSEITSLSFDF